jgi:lysozyme
MKINKAGIDLLKDFEGCRLKAYLCPAGILTIGYGHTGPDVVPQQTITQAQADLLLEHDISKFEKGIQNLVSQALTSNQFSALVCFAFNCGLYALEKSTLLYSLNHGNYSKAADEFSKWNKSKGVISPGLVRRRKAESDLFKLI